MGKFKTFNQHCLIYSFIIRKFFINRYWFIRQLNRDEKIFYKLPNTDIMPFSIHFSCIIYCLINSQCIHICSFLLIISRSKYRTKNTNLQTFHKKNGTSCASLNFRGIVVWVSHPHLA